MSPIYDLVTNEDNINKLTEASNNRFTQYWEKKEKKAFKILGKSYIDDGEYFRNEFHEFTSVNLVEEVAQLNHRDSVMVMRRHTMSSIRKHRENSVTNSMFSHSDDGGNDSPLGNSLSPFSNEPTSPEAKLDTDLQSGYVVNISPPKD